LASLLTLSSAPVGANTPNYWDPGKTTPTCIGHDQDGCWPGLGRLAPDADDNDPIVNAVASWKAKYNTINVLLAKLSYTDTLHY
jgi:hypothetical protein